METAERSHSDGSMTQPIPESEASTAPTGHPEPSHRLADANTPSGSPFEELCEDPNTVPGMTDVGSAAGRQITASPHCLTGGSRILERISHFCSRSLFIQNAPGHSALRPDHPSDRCLPAYRASGSLTPVAASHRVKTPGVNCGASMPLSGLGTSCLPQSLNTERRRCACDHQR